ncbi:uncharacterized protein TrAtP1_012005 [Trichoderma atroviride]|uniref:uncharacterized protein n=1 Tax=Hypocrea atroviridis TaxID=63577 RepID=UPI0033272DD9|nr:hypothetical protein TrAtP1_012005 [Trichoderma atroviride]
MKNSKRIEEYCDRLATAQEYETDRFIRPLVRSESLCCRLSDTFRYDKLEASNSIHGNAAVRAMVDGFLNELELIKMLSTTDASLTEIEFSYIQSYVQEGAFHHELWVTESLPAAQDKEQSRREAHRGELPVYSPVRATMLWRMLDSNKTCIRHFLATNETTMLRMPHTVILRLCYVLASLIKLTFTRIDGSSMPAQSEAAFISSQQYPYRSNIAHPIAQLTSESADALHLIDEMAAKVEICLKSPFAALNGNHAIVNGFALKLKRLSSAYRSKLQNINAGLYPSSGHSEPMVDCLKDGSLGLARPVQIDQLQTNKSFDGRQTERTQEKTIDAQPHFWTLPEEAQACDFDEREWDSILASFTLPV